MDSLAVPLLLPPLPPEVWSQDMSTGLSSYISVVTNSKKIDKKQNLVIEKCVNYQISTEYIDQK